MPPLEELIQYYFGQLIGYIPILVVLTAGVAIVSMSPLGRGLLKFLRERRRDAAVNEQLLDELTHLRTVLGEVTERLDSTERLLSVRGETPQFPKLPHDEPRPRMSTPH